MFEQKSDGIPISLCQLSFHNFKKFINFFELVTVGDKPNDEEDYFEENNTSYPN
jgi:hypothetical protein